MCLELSKARACQRDMSIVLALVIAAGVHLSPDEPTTVVQEPDKVIYKKTSAVIFTDASIEAAVTKPTGTVIFSRPPTKFRNLIELRASFRPEMSKSVGALPGQ